MIQQIEVAKMIGIAHIDNLLQEMLLGGETPPMDTTPIAFSPQSNGNTSAGENDVQSNPETDPVRMDPSLANVNLLQQSSEQSQLQTLGDEYKRKDNNQNFLPEGNLEMFQSTSPPCMQHQAHVSPRVQPYDLNMAHQQAHHHHLRSSNNNHMNQYNNNNNSMGRKIPSSYKNLNPMYDGMVTSSSGSEMMVLKEEPENGY